MTNANNSGYSCFVVCRDSETGAPYYYPSTFDATEYATRTDCFTVATETEANEAVYDLELVG